MSPLNNHARQQDSHKYIVRRDQYSLQRTVQDSGYQYGGDIDSRVGM